MSIQHFTDVERVWHDYQGRGLDLATVAVGPMDNQEKLLQYFKTAAVQGAPQVPIYLLNELTDELAAEVFQKDWEVTVPAAFGYDVQGRVVFMHTGIETDYFPILKQAADQLLSARPIR
jgi:hypothetical protein